MEAHPGIIFRAGPAGRRPDLAGGPDIWEVARAFRNVAGSGERALLETAELAALLPEQARSKHAMADGGLLMSKRVVVYEQPG